MILKFLGWCNCARCGIRFRVYESVPNVCFNCGTDGIDLVGEQLKPKLAEYEYLIHEAEAIAADARYQALVSGNNPTWNRIAYACDHKILVFQWQVRALRERIDGGRTVDREAKVLWNIASMLVTLAQHWRAT